MLAKPSKPSKEKDHDGFVKITSRRKQNRKHPHFDIDKGITTTNNFASLSQETMEQINPPKSNLNESDKSSKEPPSQEEIKDIKKHMFENNVVDNPSEL